VLRGPAKRILAEPVLYALARPRGAIPVSAQLAKLDLWDGNASKPPRAPIGGPVSAVGAAIPGRDVVDGLAYFERIIIPRIRAAVARGERCAVGFDIDNTLADSRWRTLEAVRTFGERRKIASLASLERAEDVGYDGRATCALRGVSDPDTVRDCQAHWLDFFWNADNFVFDKRIDRIAHLAHRASEEGAEIFYLTGRIETLRKKTVEQLADFGLPDADDAHVVMKPRLGIRTERFKAKALRHGLTRPPGAGSGRRHLRVKVMAFISEGRNDIHFIQRHTRVPALFYDFPLDRRGFPLYENTPVIAA
jgi:hypothetical protein